MKIAFVSTRGIPNNYGGLEEFAEKVSVRLVKQGFEVIVYNPHFHPYAAEYFEGVRVKKIYSPEKRIGTAANLIDDYLSLRDAVSERCDVILVCGYTTAALSLPFIHTKKSKIITNIDGLEWKRSKHNWFVQRLTRWFEKIAIQKSHGIISDNPGIEEYVTRQYNRPSHFIPYAAEIFEDTDTSVLQEQGLTAGNYYLLIGRLEPENNIEMILDGIASSVEATEVHIYASTGNRYARYLIKKYRQVPKIRFRGWLGGQHKLASLRQGARLYFHGHSVGGTNPSLLEAMAAGAFIAAHDNVFNRHVLKENALYFASAEDVKSLIENLHAQNDLRVRFAENNRKQIHQLYNWDHITNCYSKLIRSYSEKKSDSLFIPENHFSNR